MASTAPLSSSARRVSILKVFLLSIITFGIYYLVTVYRISHDLRRDRAGASGSWQALFWCGFITFGITWIVLYVMNFLELKAAREAVGKTDQVLGILALVLIFVTGIVGHILWAVYYNDSLAAKTPAPATPPRAAAV